MPGEFELIDWIRAQQRSSDLIHIGIGDDLAALKWPAGDLLLVGVDQIIDGVHFDSTVHSLHDIGKKAMNRNLSDCAAMACLPAAAVVAVALPKSFSLENARELYGGLRAAGDAFDCPIVGGDTSSWNGKLIVSVTILGRSAGIKPITRAGARPGDGIYVTGPLGGSMLGRHLTFEPRVAIGRKLGNIATAMIDLSDGLSRDLGHICKAGNVGAVLDADRIPIHADAQTLSLRDGISPLDHALHDGEDYELLFTAPGPVSLATRIGTIVPAPQILLAGADGRKAPLIPRGWEHRVGE
jgi:thiamine-monophosphate kinase